jgi:hypothetical protein
LINFEILQIIQILGGVELSDDDKSKRKKYGETLAGDLDQVITDTCQQVTKSKFTSKDDVLSAIFATYLDETIISGRNHHIWMKPSYLRAKKKQICFFNTFQI